jgi:hypothetical protein
MVAKTHRGAHEIGWRFGDRTKTSQLKMYPMGLIEKITGTKDLGIPSGNEKLRKPELKVLRVSVHRYLMCNWG